MYAIFAQAEGARVVEVRAGENFAFPQTTCSLNSAHEPGSSQSRILIIQLEQQSQAMSSFRLRKQRRKLPCSSMRRISNFTERR